VAALHAQPDSGSTFSFYLYIEKVHVAEETRPTEVSGNCYFAHGNILEAKTFDPFTHVYQFDVGFPPPLLAQEAVQFNKSQAKCLVSFQPPKVIMDTHGFDVRFLEKVSTSMHGSSERHSCFLYLREDFLSTSAKPKCDPLFAEAQRLSSDKPALVADAKQRLDASHAVKTSRVRSKTTRYSA